MTICFSHVSKKNGKLAGARGDRHANQYVHGGKHRHKNPNQKKGADERRNKGKQIINRIMLKMKILNDAYANNQLIAFRTPKEEWGETIVGHIKKLTPENITVKEISEYGESIGTTTFKVDDLINIVVEDKTLRCLEYTEKMSKRLSAAKCTTIWGNGFETKEQILDRMKERKIITLFVEDGEDDDTNVIGFVEDVDDKSVLVEMIDEYGEKNGKILVPLETITGVRWESLEDNSRWLLYQNSQTVMKK